MNPDRRQTLEIYIYIYIYHPITDSWEATRMQLVNIVQKPSIAVIDPSPSPEKGSETAS